MPFTTFTSASTDFFMLVPGNLQSGAGSMYLYRSSDSAGTVAGTTGYFKSCGQGSLAGMPLGLKLGDIILSMENPSGVTPGRLSWHTVVSASANSTAAGFVPTLGYDCSVSLAATT